MYIFKKRHSNHFLKPFWGQIFNFYIDIPMENHLVFHYQAYQVVLAADFRCIQTVISYPRSCTPSSSCWKKIVSHSKYHLLPIIFLRNQEIEKGNEFSVAQFSFLTIGFFNECQFIIDGSVNGCQSKSNSQSVNSMDFVKLL